MTTQDTPKLTPVNWIGRSLEDLKSFPQPVIHQIGVALMYAQNGDKAPNAKPLRHVGERGFGDRGEPPQERIPSRLHSSFQRPNLCPSLLPKEVKKGHRHSEVRYRPDKEPSQTSGTRPQGKTEDMTSISLEAAATPLSTSVSRTPKSLPPRSTLP